MREEEDNKEDKEDKEDDDHDDEHKTPPLPAYDAVAAISSKTTTTTTTTTPDESPKRIALRKIPRIMMMLIRRRLPRELHRIDIERRPVREGPKESTTGRGGGDAAAEGNFETNEGGVGLSEAEEKM